MKRLCIKTLPPYMVIQLKRFDFDWEREVAVKHNDYFEFPLEIDMEPYTADGLAKADAEHTNGGQYSPLPAGMKRFFFASRLELSFFTFSSLQKPFLRRRTFRFTRSRPRSAQRAKTRCA